MSSSQDHISPIPRLCIYHPHQATRSCKTGTTTLTNHSPSGPYHDPSAHDKRGKPYIPCPPPKLPTAPDVRSICSINLFSYVLTETWLVPLAPRNKMLRWRARMQQLRIIGPQRWPGSNLCLAFRIAGVGSVQPKLPT